VGVWECPGNPPPSKTQALHHTPKCLVPEARVGSYTLQRYWGTTFSAMGNKGKVHLGLPPPLQLHITTPKPQPLLTTDTVITPTLCLCSLPVIRPR
jgi:hypothetical protein